MPKRPSSLKWLAQTRARADGDVRRFELLLAEIQRRLTTAQDERDACDRLIRKFDQRLDPSQIPAIRPVQPYKGGRGALRATVIQILTEKASEEVSTSEIGIELMLRHGIDFDTEAELQDWQHNSVCSCLKKLMREGMVERLHDPASPSGGAGRWRLKTPGSSTIAELIAHAEARGSRVELVDGESPTTESAGRTEAAQP